MKEMKKIAEGKNFTACDFGKLNDLGGYVLQLGDIKIPGKVFGGQAVGATGGDFSFQIYQPGQEGGFYHTHKNHEELYFVLSGKGEYQVDGVNIPLPGGKRRACSSCRQAHHPQQWQRTAGCALRAVSWRHLLCRGRHRRRDPAGPGGVVIGSCRPYAPRHGFYPSAILLTIRGWHLRYYHI